MNLKFKKLLACMCSLLILGAPINGEDAQGVPSVNDVRAENDRIIIDVSQLMPYDVYTLTSPQRLVVEIPGVAYKASTGKKEVSSGLVRRIRGYQYKENPLISRIVIDLGSSVDYKTNAEDNQIVVSLKKNSLADAEEPKSNSAKAVESQKSRKKDLLSSLPREEVTLDFENADIKDVIRLMAETSNINIIFGPEVSGNISIHLKKVPFDEAFGTILNLKGLVASQLGTNILRVTTPDILVKERQKAVVYTKTIPINYLKAEEVQKHLQAIISSAGRKGTITVVSENNSLVLTDSEEGIGQAERLIAQLDKKPKQVMIEARIVEINLNNGLDIGVQWEFSKYDNVKPNGDFNYFGTISDSKENQRIGFKTTDANNEEITIGATTPGKGGTGVSLPGLNDNAAITFGFVQQNSILSATLSALVSQSKARILSAPKVVTVNGEQAKIQAVQDIRFRTTTTVNSATTTDFKVVSAGIILTVTPIINAEDRITLKIQPESSFPTQESLEGAPIIRTRTAQTTVIVKDGDTLVIGGLIDDSDTKNVTKVPLLGDIPIIGAFFKSNTNRKVRNELLVFVTPRIVRE
jgi:type IV pilus assembly protein PilQ